MSSFLRGGKLQRKIWELLFFDSSQISINRHVGQRHLQAIFDRKNTISCFIILNYLGTFLLLKVGRATE